MGVTDLFGKVFRGIMNQANDMQTCISIVEMANPSDEELMEYIDGTSHRDLFFNGTAAMYINFAIRKMAVRKVASDRGLLENNQNNEDKNTDNKK